MKKYSCLFVLLLSLSAIVHGQAVIKRGMKITRSMTFTKKLVQLSSDSLPVIHITGKNIVVDFRQLHLDGGAGREPNKYTGIGILISDADNVTLRNLSVRGYKIALLVKNTKGLRLENCDMSYNYRPRLNSTPYREDMSDWLSYHRNDNDEWLRYGAGMYLVDCMAPVITGCKVTNGQNGLMMVRTTDAEIYGNDFSFNSGIGLGLYRASGNKVYSNRIIFNIRGYSHGVYARGQDSAGILVYEQSNNNLFSNNNVTHGGDGFFLWAGQSTMDSGKGGCNDNLLRGNDFSYAATNGIEATFSRNTFDGNRLFECTHGIWAGYSFETVIRNNQFRNNRIAIAIEHGQGNVVSHNLFSRNTQAIRLWGRPSQPADWGYAKDRDVRSRDYIIAANSFNYDGTAISLHRTSGVQVFDNTRAEVEQFVQTDSTVTGLDTVWEATAEAKLNAWTQAEVPAALEGFDPFAGAGPRAGRKNIVMTEWGPYNFNYPLVYHAVGADSTDVLQFHVKGPKGKWRIVRADGLKVIGEKSGMVPAIIRAQRAEGPVVLELEYRGGVFTDVQGRRVAAKPYRFRSGEQDLAMNWEVLFYAVDTAGHDPVKTGMLFSPLERRAPIKTDTVKVLNYAWWGGLKAGGTYPAFSAVARSGKRLAAGQYEISVTWKDAVRVQVGERLVLDRWRRSAPGYDEAENERVKFQVSGNEDITIEFSTAGEFTVLQVAVRRL